MEDFGKAFVQASRWAIAGGVGAAMAQSNVLGAGIWKTFGFLLPVLLLGTIADFAVRRLILNQFEGTGS